MIHKGSDSISRKRSGKSHWAARTSSWNRDKNFLRAQNDFELPSWHLILDKMKEKVLLEVLRRHTIFFSFIILIKVQSFDTCINWQISKGFCIASPKWIDIKPISLFTTFSKDFQINRVSVRFDASSKLW